MGWTFWNASTSAYSKKRSTWHWWHHVDSACRTQHCPSISPITTYANHTELVSLKSQITKKTCLSLHISNILQPCISKNHSMNWMSLPTKIISKSWWQLVIGFLISLSQPSGRLILPSSWLSLPHMLAILGFVKDHLQSHHPLGLEDAFLFGKASYEVLMLVFGSVVVRGRGIYWCCCLSQKNIMPQMM